MKKRNSFFKILLFGTFFFATIPDVFGKMLINQEELQKKVHVKTLENGLTILMVERHEVPVFSVFLRLDVGSAQEQAGQSGLAHMFEHMAFKGTHQIGTKDSDKEKLALDKVESTYQAYQQEKQRGVDKEKVKQRMQAWKQAMEEASQFVNTGEYVKIVEQAGGAGQNAFTSFSDTGYMVSFPSNRFELWAYLESERMKKPVFREFYQERNVVMEERRMRVDSRPMGRLIEQFLATAFTAHPYGRPVLGWPADLTSISATEAEKFWETHYTPSNMVLTIVGDVDPKESMSIVEAYFGRLPKKPKATFVPTEEPKQQAEKMVIFKENVEPLYIEGYHRGNFQDQNELVYAILSEILDGGRTSRLYRSLVRDQKVASGISSHSCKPQDKYPCLFIFIMQPMPPHTIQEVRNALHEQINLLKKQLVTEKELQAAKTRFQVGLLGVLNSNMGLAQLLGTAQQQYGDWKKIFQELKQIDQVTAEDIRKVVNLTFVDENRTSAWMGRDPFQKQGGR